MTVLSQAFCSQPNHSDVTDQSATSPILVLQDDANLQPVYAIIATPYDIDAAAETTVYLSGEAFTTSGSDTPASTQFLGVVASPYNFANRLFQGGGLSGLSVPSAGAIEVENFDRALDAWADYAWSNRTIEVYVGLREYITADPTTFRYFGKVFSGVAESVELREKRIFINIKDSRYKLDVPIQTTNYAGTGGLEGDDSIKGKPKPLVYGQVRQFEPVLIDPANLLYQFHDGSAQAVDAVRDKGAALSFVADFANSTLLLASSPGSGNYSTCLAEGMFMLGASPAGAVTGDFRGDNGGTLGYQATTAGIIRKISTEQVGLSASELDLGSFSDLDSSNSSTVGIAVRTEEAKALDAVSRLVSGIGSFITFTRTGKLFLGRASSPGGQTAISTFDDTDIVPEVDGGEFTRTRAARPAFRVRLGYKPYWKTLSPNDVVGSVSDADRADFGEAFRYETDEDATLTTTYPDAEILTIDSLLDLSADASAEATRLLNLYATGRNVWSLRILKGLFKYELSDIVEIDLVNNIYGLNTAKQFIVVGYDEDAGSGNTERVIRLDLWG